jgi:hypothetical protein
MSEIALKSENTTQKPANSAKIAIRILTIFSKFKISSVCNLRCGQENIVDPKNLCLFTNHSPWTLTNQNQIKIHLTSILCQLGLLDQ